MSFILKWKQRQEFEHLQSEYLEALEIIKSIFGEDFNKKEFTKGYQSAQYAKHRQYYDPDTDTVKHTQP